MEEHGGNNFCGTAPLEKYLLRKNRDVYSILILPTVSVCVCVYIYIYIYIYI